MTFEVGRLSAALTLEGVNEFHRDLDNAGRKLSETGQKGASFGKAAEAAVRTAAGVTTGLVTAAGAYLTILTKQGVAYNSLQQNSRAALSVLLGGAEQANVQMSKLDDFARNSPFSKSVFIQAQQQLIGFGMEAGKVIPTLDAVQQSVAAMGGSNEQIAEVVNILANVNSTGKITAETFNQLGYRGIDGAQLLGDAWGKTASEIRDAVTKGEIDGKEAIDALVDSMQNKFGGAADNVKQQWSGAVDRIKAAQRDLGAHIAEPFVSAQGGGMAVSWGNQVADVLRAIEKQAIPVMGILTEHSMPFFAKLTQGLDSSAQAIKRWDARSLEVSLNKMSNHAPGIAALTGATLALGAQVGPLGKMLTTLGISANPVVAAFVGMAAASPEVRAALMGVLEAGKPLLPLIGDIATSLSGSLNSVLPVVAGGIDFFASALGLAVGILEKVPTPVITGALAFLAMQKATAGLTEPLQGVAQWISNVSSEGSLVGGVFEAAGSKAVSLGNSLKAALISNPVGLALTAISVAVGLWAKANADAQEKVVAHQNRVAELRNTLDETNGALTGATREMVAQSITSGEAAEAFEKLGISQDLFVQGVLDGGNAQGVFRHEMVKSAQASLEAAEKTAFLEEKARVLGVSYDTLVGSYLGFSEASSEVRQKIDESGSSFFALETALGEAENAMEKSTRTQRSLVSSYFEQRDAVVAAQEEQKLFRDAIREAEHAMTDAARSNQRFNDALAVVRDTSQDAETRLRALQQAMDELNGGQLTAREAALQHARSMSSLTEQLAAVDDEGGKLWKTFVGASGEISLATDAGIAFEQTMLDVEKQMHAAALEAYDQGEATGGIEQGYRAAVDAANDYIQSTRESMEAAGMEADVIDALIGKMGGIPEVIATMITDNGSFEETEQNVFKILTQLTSLEEGASVTIDNEGGEETIDLLRELGIAVDATDDLKEITITSTGKEDVVAALEVLNNIAVPEKIFEIDADDTDAFSKIDGVNITQVDDKTAYVYGNNSNAMSEIQNVINKGVPGKTAVISGNDSNFWNAWQAIKLAASIKKTVDIVQNILTVGSTANADGGLYSQGVKHFDQGGFPSGLYAGVPGGIFKPGLDGTRHVFAEKHLGVPWEVYISGKPSSRNRNIGLALEALDRLAFPVVPAASVQGTRAFAEGGSISPRGHSTAQQYTQPVKRVPDAVRRSAPLAGVINVGVEAQTSDLRKLAQILDRLDREG